MTQDHRQAILLAICNEMGSRPYARLSKWTSFSAQRLGMLRRSPTGMTQRSAARLSTDLGLPEDFFEHPRQFSKPDLPLSDVERLGMWLMASPLKGGTPKIAGAGTAVASAAIPMVRIVHAMDFLHDGKGAAARRIDHDNTLPEGDIFASPATEGLPAPIETGDLLFWCPKRKPLEGRIVLVYLPSKGCVVGTFNTAVTAGKKTRFSVEVGGARFIIDGAEDGRLLAVLVQLRKQQPTASVTTHY